jgi:hypothetical protein
MDEPLGRQRVVPVLGLDPGALPSGSGRDVHDVGHRGLSLVLGDRDDLALGTGLGALVHPAFLGPTTFVGAGLVFAGVTYACLMGMILARMPWNRITADGG